MNKIICTKDDFPYNWEQPQDIICNQQVIIRELCRSIQDVIDNAGVLNCKITGFVNVNTNGSIEEVHHLRNGVFIEREPFLNVDIHLKVKHGLL